MCDLLERPCFVLRALTGTTPALLCGLHLDDRLPTWMAEAQEQLGRKMDQQMRLDYVQKEGRLASWLR